MPTIKQKFKQTDLLLCAVCHALSDFCLLYNWTEFTFGSTGSRLVIPIATAYHFYCNSGFLIPRICNIFSMLVPRQDLLIKINQDQLKNYYIFDLLLFLLQSQLKIWFVFRSDYNSLKRSSVWNYILQSWNPENTLWRKKKQKKKNSFGYSPTNLSKCNRLFFK